VEGEVPDRTVGIRYSYKWQDKSYTSERYAFRKSDASEFLCHSGKPAKSKKSLRRRFFGGGGRSDCSADLRGLTLA